MEEHQLRCGVYEHYKGRMYLVLGVASHTETGELLAVYVPLYEHSAPAALAVRPLAMFTEDVVVEGRPRPRFRYRGTRMEG